MAEKPKRPKCRCCHNIEAEVMVFDRRLDFNTGQMKERKMYRCPQCQAYLGPCYEDSDNALMRLERKEKASTKKPERAKPQKKTKAGQGIIAG